VTAEYTVAAIAAPIAVIVLELTAFRTGILRQGRYWATVALILAFQVPVDGLLTRGPVPVVSYRDSATSHLRLVWDIPVEDFGFGFALITLTLVLWKWQQDRRQPDHVKASDV
jgi:lycopene cyclase domain-containing protein